ncbi:dTDP-Rha--alpha-D-GlcNAc-pyrophosphate polyprenol alpha-3-L-rhamnosyltransferase [Pseudonocardia sp. TRM90224]|uniref:dTDP-Rha--alpha-D-GlcNAc-pyrophosphate polyprenol alpha-3-L-rhamnosyltransferase n=1 Tax=Pseudonocardia sp. TRM90224 TaxID=2812678 RepID=UPI001E2FEBB3|nr:dTDP-Rha--alpha-D-GlcNAc-pyrophosphate polyprenol alpha-3-L-rhamnosyltransferase [Pseudonocardia sp. TRM90224]
MDAVQQYGDALAVVTVTRAAQPVGAVFTSLPLATGGQVTAVHVDTGGAPAAEGATFLRIAEDIGHAAAVNRAVAALEPAIGWVAIAAPQVTWRRGTIDVLLDAAARTPRAGALGPLVRTTAGAVASSMGALPGLLDVLRGRIRPDGAIGWLDSACLLVRRTAWDSVDGFDARYADAGRRPELADVDLGDRLGRAGWLTVHVPSAEVTFDGWTGQGILEPYDRALRRYARTRFRAPARALIALARRVR